MLKVMRNWDNVYEDYKGSGMSINAYAKKHNIPPSSAFTQMKKRLVEEGLTSENIINSSPTKNMNFIPVEVKSEYPKDICENYDKDKCKLTISIKDYKIDIYENFSQMLLKNVIEVLNNLC